MDLTTYSGLQSAVADFLNRDDLTDQIKGFIAIAEARIQRNLRRTTIRNSAFALAASATSTALPADCGELRTVKANTGTPSSDFSIPFVTVQMLADIAANRAGTAGYPQAVAVVGTNLLTAPIPDQNYTLEITYFQKLTPLSGSVATNPILLEGPDAYLYGALCAAAPYLEHDERVEVWDTMFSKAIDEMNNKRDREETGGALRRARLARVFG
jgi:hypothetical protein